MTGTAFLLVLTGVLLNAAAQMLLKAAVSETGSISLSMASVWPVTQKLISEPWLWLGLFCYGISVIVWILALSRVDVSIAYPMLSIGYIVNAFAAWWLLGESLNPMKVTGIGIIVLGVIVLARS